MGLRRALRTKKRHHAGLPWSDEEIAVLVELYPNHSDVDLATRLGRSTWSVKGKARNLGLARYDHGKPGQPDPRNSRPWSDTEIDLLKELYLNTPYEEIAEQIGRTRNAVHMKARKLGLRKMDFWTRDEDRVLRKEQIERGYGQIASILKRTGGSVKARAITLELERKVDSWTEREVRMLAREYPRVTAGKTARKIGRTQAAVAQKALRVGIVKKPRWSKAELETLHKLSSTYTSREIAELVGRSPMAVRDKLRNLRLKHKP